jgi:plasmid stabilization system protein ParE
VKVRYTGRALAQLDAIYSYIEARDRRSAIAVKARIKRAIDRLARFPYSCRATKLPGIRVLPIVRYPTSSSIPSMKRPRRCRFYAYVTARKIPLGISIRRHADEQLD